MLYSAIATLVVTVALAWPVAKRTSSDPLEQLLAGAALSLIATYLWGFAIFVLRMPNAVLLGVHGMAVFNAVAFRTSLRAAAAAPEVRVTLLGQSLITAWSIGWLCFVLNYSGGGWIGDWFGHWQRTQFFLQNGPRDVLFNGFDPLPSRPPLANVIGAVFLIRPGGGFAQYQVVATIVSSLVFLPCALLARRFGKGRAIAVLVPLLMLNPLFVQNATFGWTKLPTAFFVLTALYFFLRAEDVDAPPAAATLCAASLAAGILAHYSAGPYALVLASAALVRGRRRWHDAAWRKKAIGAFAAGAAVVATWFSWSLSVYGAAGTFLSNTSAQDSAGDIPAQIATAWLNLRDTIVPHFLRHVPDAALAQQSVSGYWRDWFFQLYQVNLLFAFGSTAWCALIVTSLRRAAGVCSAVRTFWISFIASTILVGTAVHTARDVWGLAHICLQPLVLLGLSFLAAQWPSFSRAWRSALIAGATLDFAAGIALHAGVESALVDGWLRPTATRFEVFWSLTESARMNLRAKLQENWTFLGDLLAAQLWIVFAALVIVFSAGLLLASRAAARDGESHAINAAR